MNAQIAIAVPVVNIAVWGVFLWMAAKPQRDERRRQRHIRQIE